MPVTKIWQECDTVVNPDGEVFCLSDLLLEKSSWSDSPCHLHFINLPTLRRAQICENKSCISHRKGTGGGSDDFSKLHYYLSLIVNCTNEVKCLLYLPFCNRQHNYLLSVK